VVCASALFAACVWAGDARAQESASRAAPRTGAEVYDAACAACHGADGRGAPKSTVGFDTPLPDFSDCAFATREPDADWGSIVHGGGPVRAFSRLMPAFGEALTQAEIDAALGHVRTFCDDPAWPRGELNLPRALFTEKAYPEDEAVWTTGVALTGAGEITNEIVYERRFGARNHVEIKLPFAVSHQSDAYWVGGAGDLAIGFKRAVHHSHARGRILSLAGEVIMPTGDQSSGVGAGTWRAEPFAAVGQILPREAFIQAQAGGEFSADTERARHEAFWRMTVGQSYTEGRYGRVWTPMVELLGARVLASGAAVEWDLVPQFQVTLSTRQHIMLNAGVRVPISQRQGRTTRLVIYLLWDWFDGGFFDGW
jgi:mono/diheme cytochrome c family protein